MAGRQHHTSGNVSAGAGAVGLMLSPGCMSQVQAQLNVMKLWRMVEREGYVGVVGVAGAHDDMAVAVVGIEVVVEVM